MEKAGFKLILAVMCEKDSFYIEHGEISIIIFKISIVSFIDREMVF